MLSSELITDFRPCAEVDWVVPSFGGRTAFCSRQLLVSSVQLPLGCFSSPEASVFEAGSGVTGCNYSIFSSPPSGLRAG